MKPENINPHIESILDRYQEMLRCVDSWFNRCLDAAGADIACRSGCSECCRGLFDITLLDACFLKRGFDRLEESVRKDVLARAQQRVNVLRELWPDFSEPYILNVRPEEEWEELMPDEDETPCPLLDEWGRCLVYDYRPMTCRLHGLPLVDLSGEVMHEEWCTLNFTGANPLTLPELRGEFDRLFREEVFLFQQFTMQLLKQNFNELDTFIPTAVLIDFSRFDWNRWSETCRIILNDPV